MVSKIKLRSYSLLIEEAKLTTFVDYPNLVFEKVRKYSQNRHYGSLFKKDQPTDFSETSLTVVSLIFFSFLVALIRPQLWYWSCLFIYLSSYAKTYFQHFFSVLLVWFSQTKQKSLLFFCDFDFFWFKHQHYRNAPQNANLYRTFSRLVLSFLNQTTQTAHCSVSPYFRKKNQK